MTDIKLIDNKIIFDGHADSIQECNTITNIVNALEKSSDFSKVKVESGYAEFECTKELPYGHMIFIHPSIIDIYTNDGVILLGSTTNDVTISINSDGIYYTDSGNLLCSIPNLIGLSETLGATQPDVGLTVGTTGIYLGLEGMPNEHILYYAVTALPITPEQQFNTDMNELCNIIKDKASTTGQKTIAQMKNAVDGIAKVITVSTLPESADDGVIAIIEEVE